MWRRWGYVIARRSTSSFALTNDLLRQRLTPYIEQTSYVDRFVQQSPEFAKYRQASVLLPLYCNSQTNQVEVLVLKRSEKVRSYTGMIGRRKIDFGKVNDRSVFF